MAAHRLVPRLIAVLAILMVLAGSSRLAPAAAEEQGVPVAGRYWGLTGFAVKGSGDAHGVASLVAALGATHFRPVVRWSTIQGSGPDGWDWSETDYVFQAYRETGARALVLLNSGSAGWATDVSQLTADTERTADCPPRILPGLDDPIQGDEPYYVFVQAAVARYGDVAEAWLIDNEPSEPWTWAGDAYSYACMARLAAQAIHDADPAATVVLGAIPSGTISAMVIADRLDDPTQEEFIVSFASRMWGHPMTMADLQLIFDTPAFRVWDRVDFYRQALAVLPQMDALAANVLGPRARGALAADVAWAYLDQMHTHGSGERSLIYTEMNPYLSDELALAQETTQLMIGSLATGAVQGQAYHELVDNSVERIEEPNCGLTTESLRPKIGYYAYQALISLLSPATLTGPLALPEPLVGYWFETEPGYTIYAIWCEDPTEADLSALVARESLVLVDMVGDTHTVDSERVPVGPSPAYIPVSPLGMTDVPWGHWAFDSILACMNAGIVTGYPDGSYQPENQVSRDQMAVFIARGIAGGDAGVPTGPAQASFGDIPTEHWAFRHIEFLRAEKVVSGYPDGDYRPNDIVDRGQMAVFLARARAGDDTNLPAAPAQPTFPDVTPTGVRSWCYSHVEYLAAEGIVFGYPDGLYRPELPCTRGQMAVYLTRLFNLPS